MGVGGGRTKTSFRALTAREEVARRPSSAKLSSVSASLSPRSVHVLLLWTVHNLIDQSFALGGTEAQLQSLVGSSTSVPLPSSLSSGVSVAELPTRGLITARHGRAPREAYGIRVDDRSRRSSPNEAPDFNDFAHAVSKGAKHNHVR